MKRTAALVLACLLLALSWWRSPLLPGSNDPHVAFTPLSLAGLPDPGPDLVLDRAWELTGGGESFGGYSALAALGDGNMLAVSDRGRFLRFGDPSRDVPQPRMGWFLIASTDDKREVDCESLTRDPATGTLWAGYEQSNAIVRADAWQGHVRTVHPAAMRDWPSNRGPESMLRLADGRFLVLSESRDGWLSSTGPALLFPSDPVEGAQPVAFHFRSPMAYRPTDMAQLPDGRVFILLRRLVWPMPPRFAWKIAIADPAEIRKDGTWTGKVVANL
ncbi:MAG: esterase-like activity of phytase family protein, partial [Novosphingobium sp.]|nr:esterase-like activity of phytase family protein [Novosphingobium sp.]